MIPIRLHIPVVNSVKEGYNIQEDYCEAVNAFLIQLLKFVLPKKGVVSPESIKEKLKDKQWCEPLMMFTSFGDAALYRFRNKLVEDFTEEEYEKLMQLLTKQHHWLDVDREEVERLQTKYANQYLYDRGQDLVWYDSYKLLIEYIGKSYTLDVYKYLIGGLEGVCEYMAEYAIMQANTKTLGERHIARLFTAGHAGHLITLAKEMKYI